MTAREIIKIPDPTAYPYRSLDFLNSFKGSKTGTSDCNQYVPLHAIGAHELLVFDEGIRVMEYRTVEITSNPMQSFITRYDQLISYLQASTYGVSFKYTVAGDPYYVRVSHGLITDMNGEILLCIGLNTDYIMNTDLNIIRVDPKLDKCAVFISTEFVTNPIYKNLRKKLDLMYVVECVSLGMDVIQTEKIDKWLYRNNFSGVKFKTVAAQQKFLKEEVLQEMLKEL